VTSHLTRGAGATTYHHLYCWEPAEVYFGMLQRSKQCGAYIFTAKKFGNQTAYAVPHCWW